MVGDTGSNRVVARGRRASKRHSPDVRRDPSERAPGCQSVGQAGDSGLKAAIGAGPGPLHSALQGQYTGRRRLEDAPYARVGRPCPSTTDHVRSEHDEVKRCRYDGGQYPKYRAPESFPGDTIH